MAATSASPHALPMATASSGPSALLVAAFAVVFGCLVAETVLRPRFTSLDEFNSVDGARHVARVAGLVQSRRGYAQRPSPSAATGQRPS
jgi:hypothetical protein